MLDATIYPLWKAFWELESMLLLAVMFMMLHQKDSDIPLINMAQNTGFVELGAAPIVQHYSVSSAWPGWKSLGQGWRQGQGWKQGWRQGTRMGAKLRTVGGKR